MRIRFAFAALVALGLPAAPVQAGDDDLASKAIVDVLPGWRQSGGAHMAALRVRLAPGWKTYWRAPGSAGIPPRFGWNGSRNLQGVTFHWPVPQVFEQNGMRSIGYADELILPMELTARDPSAPISLRAEVELGVCLEICMPLTVRISAELPQVKGRAAHPAITSALRNRPATAAEAGVSEITCSATPIADGMRLTASFLMPSLGAREIAIVELSDQTIWIAEAQTARAGGKITTHADMVPPQAAPFLLDRSDVRITMLGSKGAVDILGCGVR
ncbi:MAG: protein-disulfide reductase DsbD domain-containing protein [Paracoccaceae bacterium]